MKNYYSDNLYYTTIALSREIASVAETAFMDLGLTPSDAYLVMAVNEKPNIQPTEISEKILLAPSTITRMIEKLEKRSILMRKQEGKYTYVTPTTKGMDIYGSILATWDNVQNKFKAQLGNEVMLNLIESNSIATAKLKS
jgi:MarR family transcriptional regulator, organic hydroperoxide resistance regulator